MKIRYYLLVQTLRFAVWLARHWNNPKGILMDAEGDSGYSGWRRPETRQRELFA